LFETTSLLWYVPALPLLAAVLSVVFGLPSLKKWSHLPIAFALPAAAVCAFLVLTHIHGDVKGLKTTALTWFQAGDISVSLSLSADALTAIMLCVITFVGSFIAFFSIWYMKGDPGYTRYFSLMSLFVFAMTLLVLGDNFIVLFAGWEGVGVCSYLLVGYWYSKPSAAAAARKAFLVTRLGDIGLILGIFLLWRMTGFTLEFGTMFDRLAAIKDTHSGQITTACLLLFCGAIGKSAQFPLYVWLPDAMEGPTPVSALIHAATMVTAGVYLLARCIPLFVLSPTAQLIVAIIGAVTAFIAGFIALSQYDLKRVLAYSTVSQLGFMFFALGCATGPLATFAVTAAIFHLFTHAFFKAVLFLSAGSVMHAMGDVIDMRRFSGLRKLLPVTHIAFLCGALALAGIPLLSGFWSKEAIFGAGLLAAETTANYRSIYGFLLALIMMTAGMTAFYTFRAYFKTFWGPEKVPESAHVGHHHDHGEHHHASPEPIMMKVPLLILALGSLVVGIVLEPFTHWFSHFLGEAPIFEKASALSGTEPVGHETNITLMIASIAIALTGVFIAWGMFGKVSTLAERVEKQSGMVSAYSHNRLYMDEIYSFLFVKPAEFLAWVSYGVDNVIDGLGRLISFIPQQLARILQPIQIGLVQFYALAMVTGLVGFLCFLVLSTGK